MDLVGRVGLVTGAGRGIGRAIAESLARAGAVIGLLDKDPAAAESTALAVAQSTGQRTLPIHGDVGSSAEMQRAVNTTLAAFGRLDIFVANAGVWSHGRLTEVHERDWDNVFSVNLKGVLFGIQSVAPILKRQQEGKIITIASAAGLSLSSSWSAYSISKAAVLALTRIAAEELEPFEVQVNAICPGAVATDLSRSITRQTGEQFPRAISPEQVASAVLDVVCPFDQILTGKAIQVPTNRS